MRFLFKQKKTQHRIMIDEDQYLIRIGSIWKILKDSLQFFIEI